MLLRRRFDYTDLPKVLFVLGLSAALSSCNKSSNGGWVTAPYGGGNNLSTSNSNNTTNTNSTTNNNTSASSNNSSNNSSAGTSNSNTGSSNSSQDPALASSPAGGGGPSGGNGNAISAASWFAPNMFFNIPVDNAALDPQSDQILSNLSWPAGTIHIDFSIDFYIADSNSVWLPYNDTGNAYYPDADSPAFVPTPPTGAKGFESDSGTVSDGGDDHYLVIDPAHHQLIELYMASIGNLNGVRTLFSSGGGAFIWDLQKTYPDNLRGDVCTSADGGGLPIAPLLFSVEEVAAGHIDHAIRFCVANSEMMCGHYVRPTTHAGNSGSCSSGIPYGSRLRLKANYDISGLSSGAQVVAQALKKYGMILTDGCNYDALMGKRDTYSTLKWANYMGSDDLSSLRPTDFEMINAGQRLSVGGFDCVRTP